MTPTQSASMANRAPCWGREKERVFTPIFRVCSQERPLVSSPGAVQVHQPGAQVADAVAAQDQPAAGGLPHGLVKVEDSLSAGDGLIGKAPAPFGDLAAHLESPCGEMSKVEKSCLMSS